MILATLMLLLGTWLGLLIAPGFFKPILAVEFTTEGIAVIGLLLSALGGVVVYVHKLLMETQAARIKAVEVERDNWKALGMEAATVTLKAANNARAQRGQEPLQPLAAVVPEHNSPVTKAQIDTAEMATARATIVAATLDLGIDPRALPMEDRVTEVAVKAQEVAEKATKVAEDVKAVNKGADDAGRTDH